MVDALGTCNEEKGAIVSARHFHFVWAILVHILGKTI